MIKAWPWAWRLWYSAEKNGGKSGLYTADEYRGMIEKTKYELEEANRKKKEYEIEIARLKRG